MLRHWWTRKYLVLAAAVALASTVGLVALGLSTPEPALSALGPDWHCSRLAFVFTTCSRVEHSQSMSVRVAKIPVCGRLRT